MKAKALLALLLFITAKAQALIPVIDTTEIQQMVMQFIQLKKQYEVLQNSYRNSQMQLATAREIAKDEEGHYGYGNLLNSAENLKDREWSPDNWDDALKGLSGGNPERYRELLREYQQNHPTLSQEEYEKGADKDQAKSYIQQVQENRTAKVNADYAFNDINKHLQNIYKLSGQIDKATDEKAALDLNSRLVAETAYIQTQMLKMQILLNEQLAEQSAGNIEAQTEKAKFDKLPDE